MGRMVRHPHARPVGSLRPDALPYPPHLGGGGLKFQAVPSPYRLQPNFIVVYDNT